jgi:hypothetical protein
LQGKNPRHFGYVNLKKKKGIPEAVRAPFGVHFRPFLPPYLRAYFPFRFILHHDFE